MFCLQPDELIHNNLYKKMFFYGSSNYLQKFSKSLFISLDVRKRLARNHRDLYVKRWLVLIMRFVCCFVWWFLKVSRQPFLKYFWIVALCTILCKVFSLTHNALDLKQTSQWQGTHNYMNEYEDIYVAVVERHTLDSANTFPWWNKSIKGIRMNDAAIIIVVQCCDDFPSTPIYKMHGEVGGCVGPEVN